MGWSSVEGPAERSTRHAMITVLVAVVLVATAFAVTGLLLQRSRAELLAGVPLQWWSHVNAAIDRGEIPNDASPAQVKNWLAADVAGLSENAKRSWVNPQAAKAVASREAVLGTSEPEPPAVTGTGKILVLLVEFGGTDTFKGGSVSGPLHGQVPQPGPDNNADYWSADTSTQHYADLLFGSSGLSLKNFYEEQSNGLFTVDGYVSAWVTIPNHSEWYYGADSRSGGEGSDDLNGPTWQMTIDAVKAAYDTYGLQIPWAEFDANQDGWIDSLMVIHAGAGQDGTGAAWTVWSHSWFVNYPYGYEVDPINLPGLRVGSYTTEPENEAVGVFAHEYGHQLGLPDEYDVTYLGETSVGFTGVMASGSWGPGPGPDGRIVLGVMPSGLNPWDRYVLGWLNGQVAHFDESSLAPLSAEVKLAQIEGAKGTRAIQIELPAQNAPFRLPAPPTGSAQWYSGYKADVADVLAGSDSSSYVLTTKVPFTVPAAGATLTFSEWYDIEPYYDWAHVEVSADGTSWTALAGRYTTDANPYGGNDGNGITGASKRYVKETMDLTPFAGQSLSLRFRLTQDGAVYGLGWTLDDIVVQGADGSTLLSDFVDPGTSPALWTATATDQLGPGWSVAGASYGGTFRQYYILEWRHFVGFDATLATSYQFIGTNTVEFWSHTEGLFVWYRNFAIGDNSVGLHPGYVAIGLVDAHPEPLKWPDGHYFRQRMQVMDAAFSLRPSVENQLLYGSTYLPYPGTAAQPAFDDANSFFYSQSYKGYYEFIGQRLPTYGLHVTVLSEARGLTAATIGVTV